MGSVVVRGGGAGRSEVQRGTRAGRGENPRDMPAVPCSATTTTENHLLTDRRGNKKEERKHRMVVVECSTGELYDCTDDWEDNRNKQALRGGRVQHFVKTSSSLR